MSGKMNCWEIMECGRGPGGTNTDEFGICPAALDESVNGVNGGKNGGRICWAVAGTFCKGEIQGVFACKIESCMSCRFFQSVSKEEGDQFHLMPPDGDLVECPDRNKKDYTTGKKTVPATD